MRASGSSERPCVNPDRSEEDILYELLQRHPEADQKIGAGVQAFFKKKSRINLFYNQNIP